MLLVALFMPWFSGTVQARRHGAARVLGSADGPRAHGYMWFVFALAIMALIVLVARDAIGRVPGNLPSPEQMLMVATGLALLLTILADRAIKPSPGLGVVGPVYCSCTPSLADVVSRSAGATAASSPSRPRPLVAFLAAVRARPGVAEPSARSAAACTLHADAPALPA